MRFSAEHTASIFRRIHDFLTRQPVAVALGDLALPIARLDAVIDELTASIHSSDARRRNGVAATGRIKALTRTAKFSYLKAVARAARVVFRHDPDLRRALRVPRGTRSPEQVLEALGGMADVAVRHKAEFAKAGFADDFAERMHARADELRAAIDDRAKEAGLRSNACQAKRDAGEEGDALLVLIDTMVTIPLEATPPLLREWKRLYRMGRVRSAVAEAGADVSDGDPMATAPVTAIPFVVRTPPDEHSVPQAA